MIVTCEECKTGFNLDEGRIGELGSKVRCSKCGNTFTVYKTAMAEQVTPELTGRNRLLMSRLI